MRGIAGVLALTVTLSACSFTVDGPRKGLPVGQRPACDEHVDGWLTLDGMLGSAWSLAAIGGAGVLLDSEGDEEEQGLADFGGALILTGSIMAVLHWSAFVVGRDRARACRKAVAGWKASQPATVSSPPPSSLAAPR